MSDNINALRQSSLGGKFRFLLKDSFVYGGISALSKFFSIFLTPILVRLMSPAEYGTVDILNPVIAILSTIVVFGMDSAIARFYYITEDETERKLVVSNAFWVQVMITAVLCTIVFVVAEPLLKGYLGANYSDDKIKYLYTINLIVLFSTPLRFAQNLLRWIFQRGQFLVLSIGTIVLNFIFILVGIFCINDKVLAVFAGQVTSTAICSVYALFAVRRYVGFTMEKEKLYQMLKYGVPLMIVAFIPSLLPSLDRYFINRYIGLEDVATYGIGYRIASLSAIPILSMNTALGPFIYAVYKENNAGKVFNLVTFFIIIFISVMIMVIVLCSPLILKIIATPVYISGLYVVAPLSFYYLFDMLKSIGGMGIDLTMKTYLNPFLYAVNILLVYVFLQLFTPAFGIFGTANALLLGAFCNYIIISWVSSRLYPITFHLLKQTAMVFLGYLISIAIYYLGGGAVLPVLYSILLIIGYVIVSLFVFFGKDDRNKLKNILGSRLQFGA